MQHQLKTQIIGINDEEEIYNNPNIHSEEQDELEIPDEILSAMVLPEKGLIRSALCSSLHIAPCQTSSTVRLTTYTNRMGLAIRRDYVSDFGLSGLPNERKSDNKIYGVSPYIAPEVSNGEQYTLSSDIHRFEIYNGLRQDLEKEILKFIRN
ncbi:hypothetical protein C1645_813955 [Glomus cerebriforme]|uniref:Protein kinase domain-containing protein n=1 Tax=Glomus cerebriforme TaxID=658196 RepID=A0A397TH07_9GLOM|nr:hypothetical protein C1645_813955 [Glomus cerebriforme]